MDPAFIGKLILENGLPALFEIGALIIKYKNTKDIPDDEWAAILKRGKKTYAEYRKEAFAKVAR